MIGVGGRERGLPPLVGDGHLLDTVDGKRKFRSPWLSGQFVCEIELGRRRVGDGRLRAEIVHRLDQQMRLLAAHKVDVANGLTGIASQRRRPDETGGAVAQEIEDCDGGLAIHARGGQHGGRATPTVAGLIQVEARAVSVEIKNVG